MPKLAHVLTGIPRGSRVTIFACGRFPKFEEVVESGAIGFNATPNAYPVKVSVRANVAGATSNGMTVLKDAVGQAELKQPIVARGGYFDVTISTVKEFNPGGEEIYEEYNPRVGPDISAYQVNAPDSDATRIFTIVKCESCAVEIGLNAGRFCKDCSPRILTCEHIRLGATSPIACGNALLEGYDCCRQHAEALGLYVPKAGRPARVHKRPTVARVKPARGKRPKKPAVVQIEEPEQLALPLAR